MVRQDVLAVSCEQRGEGRRRNRQHKALAVTRNEVDTGKVASLSISRVLLSMYEPGSGSPFLQTRLIVKH